MTQAGAKLQIKIVSASGYNASIAQNCLTEIYFKTSNGSSFQAGSTGNFFADGQAWRTGPNNTTPSTIRVLQAGTTTYDIYGNFAAYSGTNSFYTVSVANGAWTNFSTTSITPGGNYIDLPIYQILDSNNYNTYAPTLTGTGASGTWGISITGNAATATTASNVNNGTLTLATSGTGISGSATFTANQSGAATFTVTSNASSVNNTGAIVARDASGNFAAGTITANLTGTATTATNLGSGAAGSIPYQTAANATAMLSIGTAGQYLTVGGAGAPVWSTFPTIGGGTLTMGVSGNGLSGSATFNANQSGGATFTVTSNATAANTASTIAYRDTSGGFAIGYVNNNTWYTYNDNDRNANSATYYPNAATRAVRYFFANSSTTGTGGNYAGVLQFNPWDGTTASTGDASYQLAFGSTAANGGGIPELNIRKGIDTTWNSWYTILHSGNYNSYSPTLSGAGANGTWGINVTGYSANVLNAVTFNNGGAGGASGSTFNGSSGLTVSYNTIGAPSTTGTNASGTWGISITGNAATATTASNVNNGTLTMNVSGNGLSGSQTFTANQSSAATFTVTSNATNANTANTIVYRDASGNFSAGTITATLSGNATNVTGTVAVGNGGTGQTSWTASGIVYASATNALANTSNFVYDATNIRLGIGGTPTTRIHSIGGGVSGSMILESTGSTNSATTIFSFSRSSTTTMTNQTVGALQWLRKLNDATDNLAAQINVVGSNQNTSPSATMTIDALTILSLRTGGVARASLTSTGVVVPLDLQASTFNGGQMSGFRNMVINGGMVIDQRNNGAAVVYTAATQTYVVDRFGCFGTLAGRFTIQRNQGSVTPPAGFSNYLGVTSSAATVPGATDLYALFHKIEGFNFSRASFGTANAQSIVLSFWVRSSLAGTFGGGLFNAAANRNYVFSYSISTANTWERKSITITGDTTGTWLSDNGAGLQIWWDLGAGSSNRGTAGSWTASVFYGPTGSTNVVGTTGATFYITGVQIEVGTAVTPFGHRNFATEFAMCQRYYEVGSDISLWSGYAVNGSTYYSLCRFATTKRVNPTVTSTYVAAAGFPATAPATLANRADQFWASAVCNATSNGGYFQFSWVASAEL